MVRLAVGFVVRVAAAWVICVSVQRGHDLQRTAPEVFHGAAPLVGRNVRDGWDWRFAWGWVGAGVVAIALTASCWRALLAAIRGSTGSGMVTTIAAR